MAAPRPQRVLAAAVALCALLLCVSAGSDPFLEARRTSFKPYAAPGPAPVWKHKDSASTYIYQSKDWSSVVSACKALGYAEKRLAANLLYLVYHNPTGLYLGDVIQKYQTDPSYLSLNAKTLHVTELISPGVWDENNMDTTKRALAKIASFYDASLADTFAVCAAVSVEVLSAGRVKVVGGRPNEWKLNFPVGRLDTPYARAPLPGAESTPAQTLAWFSTNLGMTSDEYIALMGFHGLVSKQDCLIGPDSATYCNPGYGNCPEARSLKLGNQYYMDTCTPSIDVRDKPPMDYGNDKLSQMPPEEFAAAKLHAQCRFSSPLHKVQGIVDMAKIHAGYVPEPITAPVTKAVYWSSLQCEDGKLWGAVSCNHGGQWFYTANDAYLGQACAGNSPWQKDLGAVQNAMRKYVSQPAWDSVMPAALIKLLSRCNFAQQYLVSGRECSKAWVPDYTLGISAAEIQATNSLRCKSCLSGVNSNCDARCICQTSFTAQYYANKDSAPQTPQGTPLLTNLPDTQEQAVSSVTETVSGSNVPLTTTPGTSKLPGNNLVEPDAQGDLVPTSPYVRASDACRTDGVLIKGFPASDTFIPKVFQNKLPYLGIPERKPDYVYTHSNGFEDRTMHAYEFNVVDRTLPIGNDAGCKGPETSVMCYDGTVPGPLISVPVGRQALVRFNNKIGQARPQPGQSGYDPKYGPSAITPFKAHPPCDGVPVTLQDGDRSTTELRYKGRGFSVHLHGSASLAPYDGWADDSTCPGESKDYWYPNNRPTTLWYHDHEYGITSDNAHFGLAALYLTKTTSEWGIDGMWDRWGMDTPRCADPAYIADPTKFPQGCDTGPIDDWRLILTDRVFESQCQFKWLPESYHRNGFFGDVNLVSGVPFPYAEFEPKLTRFRILSAGISRPWLVKIVDDTGKDYSSSINPVTNRPHCHMIGGDGGYRRAPLPFPSGGLFFGVAERYEFVCDFSDLKGKPTDTNLYMWNEEDLTRMKDVPFFCNSHLLMKMVIKPGCYQGTKNCDLKLTYDEIPTHLDDRVPAAELAESEAAALAGRCDRKFVFGRGNGIWTINGETWETAQFGAKDVALNSREIWCLEAGGGWFHPIHIHLIDMYVLNRNSGSHPALEEFERYVPKDVVALHPGARVWVMPRWGPHRGKYMFHCHNLRHEDDDMMRALNVSTDGSLAALSLPSPEFTPLSKICFKDDQVAGTADDGTPLFNTQEVYDRYESPLYVNSNARPSIPDPQRPLQPFGPMGPALFSQYMDMELHRIFYPGRLERDTLCDRNINKWLVEDCKV